jgi:hypothetical protein
MSVRTVLDESPYLGFRVFVAQLLHPGLEAAPLSSWLSNRVQLSYFPCQIRHTVSY